MRRTLLLAGPALGAAAGIAHLGLLLWIFAGRLSYPLDLEWMEGGMLCHALRAMHGQPIYAPPSVDFISYLYTPFYPYLLATLGKLFGLSYTLGRLISIAAFLGVLALVFRAVCRQTGGGWSGRLWGIAAVGLIASSFPSSGAWYDLVRNDSLYLLLITAALYLLQSRAESWRWMLVAGVLAGLAFLTKQTASLFIIFGGLALLVLRWKRVPVFAGAVALVAGGTVLLLQHATDGWFWRYTYGMHQGHDLYWDRVWPVTELKLFHLSPVCAVMLGLWVVAVPVTWIRRRRVPAEDRAELYWLGVALTGVLVSAVGFATQWASENAYIPGLVFPGAFAVLAAAALGRKAGSDRGSVLSGVVMLVLGGALAAQMAIQLYSPRPHLPSAADRRTARELLAVLREVEGPVLMPYHPYYPVLVGKPAFYHQMGINDVTRALFPFPPSVIESIAARRYGAVVLDNPPQGRYEFLLAQYKLGRYFRGDEVPAVVTGYRVRPTYLFVPKRPEPPRPGWHSVLGFESGDYQGWTALGTAFGSRPVGGPVWDQGPVGPFEGSYLANSYHGGDLSTGMLTSPEFVVDRPLLSYRIGGGNDRALLRLRLLVDGAEVHSDTGPGADIMVQRVVDVRRFLGRRMRAELTDRATGGWGHLLFDDLTLGEQR